MSVLRYSFIKAEAKAKTRLIGDLAHSEEFVLDDYLI